MRELLKKGDFYHQQASGIRSSGKVTIQFIKFILGSWRWKLDLKRPEMIILSSDTTKFGVRISTL